MTTNANLEALVEPVSRISRDMMKALRSAVSETNISDSEARFLVDLYYTMQEDRIRLNNQVKGLERDAKKEERNAEPHDALDLMHVQCSLLEDNVKRILGAYVDAHPMSWFFDQTHGVGPVIAAGLLSHIDITKAPTVGHIWNFAGLNPGIKWEKGQKRPWNTPLKTLCWKIGESFVKVSNSEKDYYGKVYKTRKQAEWAKNLNGDFADQAARKLETTKIGKTTDAFSWYSGQIDASKAKAALGSGDDLKVPDLQADEGKGTPMLPPAHIHSRARRYAVKLFLSHLHECWYRQEVGEPAKPFAIAIQGHAHYLPPPQKAAVE